MSGSTTKSVSSSLMASIFPLRRRGRRHLLLLLLLLLFTLFVSFFYLLNSRDCLICRGPMGVGDQKQLPTLESIRESLIRQEDSIVFALIERARFPRNAPAYNRSLVPQFEGRSLAEVIVRESEALQSKAGRYQNPEEVPFFPDDLPSPLVVSDKYPQIFHPASASVTVSDTIWNMYFNDLLPLFTVEGDDGNYAATAAADLVCLQALSRRIHYGKFVAESKFTDAPHDYSPGIRDKDTNGLMKLLTFTAVEDMVKRRVKKKAMTFGQNVTLVENKNDADATYKVDPMVVYNLYEKWVIPMTKHVEVEYLLRRLD